MNSRHQAEARLFSCLVVIHQPFYCCHRTMNTRKNYIYLKVKRVFATIALCQTQIKIELWFVIFLSLRNDLASPNSPISWQVTHSTWAKFGEVLFMRICRKNLFQVCLRKLLSKYFFQCRTSRAAIWTPDVLSNSICIFSSVVLSWLCTPAYKPGFPFPLPWTWLLM